MNASKYRAFESLYLKDFRLFVLARFCVTLGIQLQAVIVSWQVYEITHDELSLGLIGLAEALPSIVVSLYAGHIADIVRRKKIIVLAVFTLAACSFFLLFFTLDLGSFILDNGVFPIYAVIFLSGIARGFLSPATFSFMPQLVTKDLYSNAVTLNSSFWQAAAIAGQPLGGLIYGLAGITVSYLVDVSLVSVGLLLFISITNHPLPMTSTEDSGNMIAKIKTGLRFVKNNQILLSAISLDLFAVLFGGAVALLPVFAKDVLAVGPLGLGTLRAAPWVGALFVGFYLAHYPIQKNMGKILLSSVAGFGICMIAFAFSTHFLLSLCILALSGGFDCVSVIIRATLLQTLTPENMKGRVSAVNNIFIGSSNEIGAFESGLTAKYMGTIPSVVFGGCMTLLVVAVTGWKAIDLRRLQKL